MEQISWRQVTLRLRLARPFRDAGNVADQSAALQVAESDFIFR